MPISGSKDPQVPAAALPLDDKVEPIANRIRLWSQVVVHELRQRVAVVKGYSDLLQPTAESAPRAEPREHALVVSRLCRAVQRLERLTQDLTELTHLQSGQLSVLQQPLDLVSLCQEVAVEQGQLTGRYVVVDLPDSPIFLSADAERLSQVLGNLMLVAHDHCTYGGRVRLSLAEEGGLAVLRVLDNCPGLGEGDVPHLFDPLYQGTTEATSHGLGLYLAKVLVEAQGGVISVVSLPEKGCTFEVRLPIPADPLV